MRACYVCNGWYKFLAGDVMQQIFSKTALQKIKTKLAAWLSQIQQDNPLPHEICVVYFIVDFANGDIELSYSADDQFTHVLDYGSYQPLEAEYFFCAELHQTANKVFALNAGQQKKIKHIKQQIVFELKQVCTSVCSGFNFLKNKIIVVGERFVKI